MGKKRSWLSALKRLLACNSKKKPGKGSAKKNAKEKKKARRILSRGEFKSFLFREPSSIEKILGEVDQQQLFVGHPTSEQSGISSALPVQPTSPRVNSPGAASPRTSSYKATTPSASSPQNGSPKAASTGVSSPKAASPKATSPRVTSLQVSSPRAASQKATSPREASPITTSPKEASHKAISPREASAKTTSLWAASRKVTSPREASPKTTSPWEASRKAASPREATPKTISPRAASRKAASPSEVSPKSSLPRAASEGSWSHEDIRYADRPEPTLTQHLSASKIQAAYRCHMARRSFKSLRGLARLQGVVRSNSVKRQTVNTMRKMQFLVRVQMQIKSRRIQMFENQALQSQAYRNDKEVESTLSKWTQLTDAGHPDDWDNSVLTKEEVDARRREKVEGVMKRERALAYAYSHQLSRSNPKSAVDIRASGIPWWWNWLDHQLPLGNDSESQSVSKSIHLTPRSISKHKPSPWRLSPNFRRLHLDYDNSGSVTPRSTKSAVPLRGMSVHTPRRTSPMSISSMQKFSRTRASASNSPFSYSMKDDDSLTSCPPFSGPSYMSPTISAKAKFRAKRTPDRTTGSPSTDPRRRLTFPLTPKAGSFRGSGKDATSLMEHDSTGDHMSMNSSVSMPAVDGRKPFNRYV